MDNSQSMKKKRLEIIKVDPKSRTLQKETNNF